MKERARTRSEAIGSGPSGLGDIFDAYADASATATVRHGVYAEDLPIAEMTVGEIRSRYGDRFDIDPRSQAEIDSVPVGNETTVRAGQVLTFSKRAGVKGASGGARAATAATAASAPPREVVTIEGDRVTALSREGQTASIPLADLLRRMTPPRMGTGGVVIPDGVKLILSKGDFTIWVHETPPRVFHLKWIAPDSASPHGREAKYRTVRMALPYVVLFGVFGPVLASERGLTHANECFFATRPVTSLADPLLYPALLNCSKFEPPDGKPLSWICTQYIDVAGLAAGDDVNSRMRNGLRALLRCLFETGFNYSSEQHEHSSWFTESARVDPRVASVEAWEAATAKDANFVLDVPWIPVGLSIGQVAERIFENHHAEQGEIGSASDVARLVFNNGMDRRERRARQIMEMFL
jgi:hypothetical protein